jgi:hypothetical protein
MKEMNHQQAIAMHAAERYLLEELSAEERAEFEEHYFGCVQCADDVRTAFRFADNMKAAAAEQKVRVVEHSFEPRSRSFDFWHWLKPAFAGPALAVALLGVTLYQSLLVIPGLERRLENATAPRAIPSTVARAATRGEEVPVVVLATDPFLQVFLDINSALPVSSYICDVYDAAGVLKFTVRAQPTASGSINLLLPATALQPGRYTVKVTGESGSGGPAPSDNYSFLVQRK